MNLRENIVESAGNFFEDAHEQKEFVPGQTYIPPTGKVLDRADCEALVDASLDMWLTAGRYADEFERELPKKFGTKLSRLTVSGSAANLLAFTTLTSSKLGANRIAPGSEVITVAAGFPTTVAPIVQNGCVPVFVDIDQYTHNVNVDQLADAITPKTKAVMVAHSLGNPFEVTKVKALCENHNLYLIEDCCDAFGAKINGQGVGTFGDLATLSFYPAHHITMGEGGAVLTDSLRLARICESYRDWGRDCYCKPGMDNTCGRRFDWQLGDLPHGYDHKYTYSHLGYNLKVSDMQAALGVSQLKKIDYFIARRNANFDSLKRKLISKGLDDFYHLPQATEGSEPSWFGFLLTIKDPTKLSRRDVISDLEAKKVGTRLLFGGNLIKQPAFKGVNFRAHGDLAVTDKVMNDSFWIGVWPGITEEMIDYMVDSLASVTQENAK
ncbi:lipopolysaccharide biosynthesis protein RfbH [Roseobacter sp. HKCCA0882]|uniref:lipopolysaccharide biosynthesis protein RfbH n=1 Tax=Roseobacter sp. HKCCA0882 TaxID=3120337 RepID=UPI0030EE4D35